VPGYDHTVPSGTKYIRRADALIKSALMGLKPELVLSTLQRVEGAGHVAPSGQKLEDAA
jgi:hypothetical protein